MGRLAVALLIAWAVGAGARPARASCVSPVPKIVWSYPADGATGSELVAASEQALQQAKTRGPGSVLGVQGGVV